MNTYRVCKSVLCKSRVPPTLYSVQYTVQSTVLSTLYSVQLYCAAYSCHLEPCSRGSRIPPDLQLDVRILVLIGQKLILSKVKEKMPINYYTNGRVRC